MHIKIRTNLSTVEAAMMPRQALRRGRVGVYLALDAHLRVYNKRDRVESKICASVGNAWFMGAKIPRF